LIADATTEQIMSGLGHVQVRVRGPEPDRLLTALREHGFQAERVDAREVQVEDGTAEKVGELAHALHIPLHHLSEVRQSLEDAYMELTNSSVEYHGRELVGTTEVAR
jgi:ABC-2 type transport system ATP-binding protein